MSTATEIAPLKASQPEAPALPTWQDKSPKPPRPALEYLEGNATFKGPDGTEAAQATFCRDEHWDSLRFFLSVSTHGQARLDWSPQLNRVAMIQTALDKARIAFPQFIAFCERELAAAKDCLEKIDGERGHTALDDTH